MLLRRLAEGARGGGTNSASSPDVVPRARELFNGFHLCVSLHQKGNHGVGVHLELKVYTLN